MNRFLMTSALFAMHPDFLAAFLKQGTIEALLPDALKNLAAMMAGSGEAAKPADPIREGATAIVPVRGMLGPSAMGRFQTPTDVLSNRMRELAADPKVGAIVLDIASPGGYVFGTAEAGDAIFEARQSKPVVAVANPYSYSAAHWLATQASAFYASPSAEVGSVGVRSGHVDVSGFEDKIGMKTTLIASDPDKIAGHPYAPLSDEDRASIEADVAER
jgi:ClpP class serine protease